MKDFLMENISLLVSGLFLIVSFILALLKNKTKLPTSFLSLLEKLPDLINDAESKGFYDGKAKKAFVFEMALNYLSVLTGKDFSFLSKKYGGLVSNAIEAILSTPCKKGENVDEKKND